jgi:hypothetical protein
LQPARQTAVSENARPSALAHHFASSASLLNVGISVVCVFRLFIASITLRPAIQVVASLPGIENRFDSVRPIFFGLRRFQ